MAATSINLSRRIEAGHIEYWRVCSTALPGAELQEERDLVRLVTGRSEAPWLNGILWARFDASSLAHEIDDAMTPFREGNLPMLWSVGETSTPERLGRGLEHRGLTQLSTLAAMAIELERLEPPEPPSELSVERVRDVAGLDRWLEAYVGGFEMSEASGRVLHELYGRLGLGDDAPFRHYVGTVGGRPVASATLFLAEGEADVWHISTLPEARGRGIGAAMTIAALRGARDLGYRYGSILATPMGARVYARLGFEQHGELVQYVWSP